MVASGELTYLLIRVGCFYRSYKLKYSLVGQVTGNLSFLPPE
jgi:hypothetical protein